MVRARRKFYAHGIRFECQKCGRCCVSRGQYNYLYLTLEDRRRLAAHLGMSTLQFTKRYCRKAYGEFHLKRAEEDCPFLNGKCCTVYEARPTQCRTWPFWRENMNPDVWKKEVVSYCPGVGKGRLYSAEEIEAIMAQEEDAQPERARSLVLDVLMAGKGR